MILFKKKKGVSDLDLMNMSEFTLSLIKESGERLGLDFDLTTKSFGFVKYQLPKFFEKKDYEGIFKNCYGYLEKNGVILFKKYLHILDEIERIYKLEKVLESPPDFDLINAGIRKYDLLGVDCVTINIAELLNKSIEEVKAMSYIDVYTIQFKKKIDHDVQENINKKIK
jgi:hypothetical protein